MKTIAPNEVPAQVFHSYLLGSVSPRPIAFVSSIDQQGRANLSPFSFFNCFGSNPPILVFGPNHRGRDHAPKNTYENVLEVPEVVISMVSYEMVEQMNVSSGEFARGVNEFVKAGFTEEPSVLVRPPRVRESPAQFECKVLDVIKPKPDGTTNLVICEVVLAHFSEQILDENGRLAPLKTDWIGRMGGDWYVRASGEALFHVARPVKGIGFDQIPDFIKHSSLLTGNELGKLANVESLPSADDIQTYQQQLGALDESLRFEQAKTLLANNQVREAWLTLLG
ncbi:MAG: flavin reductase family protein [Spirosomataceae bacterium]